MSVLDFILLLLIFIICYLVVKRWYIKHEVKKYCLSSNAKKQTKEIKFKNFISKINFLKTKDLFLLKQGYPLRLDSLRYYTLKITLSLIFFIAGVKNYDSNITAVILALIGWFFIDVYIFVNKKSRDSEICNDLYNVTNSICLQLSSHVSLKDSIKYQFQNCKNKDFQKAMIEFSACYELTELNIDNAVNVLNSKFDILEINMFCNALTEYNKTGDVVEILENLASNLGEKQIDVIKDQTRTKIVYITIGVIIALINIILLVFYPLFISLGQGFDNLFK